VPRYFFHIKDGVSSLDEEGTVLKDLATAKCQAVQFAGRMICDTASTFWDKEEWKLTVTDERGLTLFSLVFLSTDAPAT
jgi:hypothetical protein